MCDFVVLSLGHYAPTNQYNAFSYMSSKLKRYPHLHMHALVSTQKDTFLSGSGIQELRGGQMQ